MRIEPKIDLSASEIKPKRDPNVGNVNNANAGEKISSTAKVGFNTANQILFSSAATNVSKSGLGDKSISFADPMIKSPKGFSVENKEKATAMTGNIDIAELNNHVDLSIANKILVA